MKERIKFVRTLLKKNQTDFGALFGVSKSAVQKWESGENVPVSSVISLMAKEAGANEVWLRTGEGDPLVPMTKQQMITNYLSHVVSNGSPIQQAFISVMARTTPEEWAIFEKKLVELVDEIKKETDQ